MKKIFTILAAMMLAGSMAAANYTHSVGGVFGGMMGASYKGFIFGVDGLALQADLGVGLTQAAGTLSEKEDGEKYSVSYNHGVYTFEANPNVVYQQPIKEWGFGSLDWYAGGGLSLGLWNQLGWTTDPFGKFGINAVGGVELGFSNVPLALGFDFRPGYGLAFRNLEGMTTTINYFDWKLAASLRYCF